MRLSNWLKYKHADPHALLNRRDMVTWKDINELLAIVMRAIALVDDGLKDEELEARLKRLEDGAV